MSAIIAHHLAANHTKPDDALELWVHKLEDCLQDYDRHFNQLESRFVCLEQKTRLTLPVEGGAMARTDIPHLFQSTLNYATMSAALTAVSTGGYSGDPDGGS